MCSKVDPLKIIQKYYVEGSDIYRTLLIHSEYVRDKALEIAYNHAELKLNVDFVSEAAMLHDIGIFQCYAPEIHCHGNRQYIEHGYLGAAILSSEGLPLHALVCERHTGVGLSLIQIVTQKLPLPHREMMPVSLEEQVICYADKFFSKSKLGKTFSVDKIRRQLGHYGNSVVDRFDEWHVLFDD